MTQEKLLMSSHIMPANMKSVLDEAKAAQARLVGEGLKVLKKLKGSGDKALVGTAEKFYKEIKDCTTTANQSTNNIEHMLQWSEMPDESAITKKKVDEVLFEAATQVEHFNEVIEMAKGSLKARSS
jgi:hypothetical protein